MKKLLITGATGFLGREIIQKKITGYEVFCFVRKGSVDKIPKNNLNYVVGDLNDDESIKRATKGISVVLHLATSHIKGNEKESLYYSQNLIKACRENKVKKIIFVSSMAVKRKIKDNYGETKLRIEDEIKNSGIEYTIIRPTMVYSLDNLSVIGQSLKDFPFVIPIIGDGKSKISPVFIADLVEGIIKILNTKNSKNKVYEIGGKSKISLNEVIQLCKKRFKIKKVILHIPKIICIGIFKIFPIVSVESVKGVDEDTQVDSEELKKDLNLRLTDFKEKIKDVNL